MQSPANQPEFKAASIRPSRNSTTSSTRRKHCFVRWASRRGEAAEAVRERVTETLNQARARLAATAAETEAAVASIADKTDTFVHRHPWQAVAIAALLGGVVTFLIAKSLRREPE